LRFLFCIILYDYKDEEAADNKDDHILHNLMPSDNKDEEAAAKIIRDAVNAFRHQFSDGPQSVKV